MPMILFALICIGIGVVAFAAARRRALMQTGGEQKQHSRPHHHGWRALMLSTLPALALMAIWGFCSSVYLTSRIESRLAAGSGIENAVDPVLALGLVKDLAKGLTRLDARTRENLAGANIAELTPKLQAMGVAVAPGVQDYMLVIAADINRTGARLSLTGGILGVAQSLAGAAFALHSVRPRARARNQVERMILWGLFGSSTIAIATTIGIVASLLLETIQFFKLVPTYEFFFGTVWDPRFSAAGSAASHGQFGLIPLLAGTLYISLIALLVAAPLGLMSAVYMAEYASRWSRSIIKPALELLAGIPTIVYGIFALTVMGPFLRDLSAVLNGGTPFYQAQSVFTAGLVMGIMLIPMVSSLSDDIITAVPQALRDGSLGLGATRSETIKRVVLPAALPGIVGAILLTASRAIGETMIVVLAAGVAANLTVNPFEAMTTITVKIVNLLTGDTEFNSPQTLAAFALGLTLFVVTLMMNFFALHVVRKYREQYE